MVREYGGIGGLFHVSALRAWRHMGQITWQLGEGRHHHGLEDMRSIYKIRLTECTWFDGRRVSLGRRGMV